MEHVPAISVVVPVYRVEPYLNRCIESILAQTFRDFELILVDDGSPDRCPQMCDEWAQRDHRIQVIHKENGGLPDARNAGIAAATGAYLAFVDSDDWVEPDFLQTLYQGMVSNGADVVQCAFRRIWKAGETVYRHEPKKMDRAYIEEELLPQMVRNDLRVMSNHRWNKMYRTQIVKKSVDLCDTTISMGEDFLMNFAVFARCQIIVVLETRPLYNYYINPSSMTSVYNSEYKYEKDRYFANLRRIAVDSHCQEPDIYAIRNRSFVSYIYMCSICTWDRTERRKEIQEIVTMLDRKLWYSTIKTLKILAERICNYMTFFGMIGPMLWLVDVVKKVKKIP